MKNQSNFTLIGLLTGLSLMLITSFTYAAELNSAAYVKYCKADKELHSVYQSIVKQYSTQPLFMKKLKAAQRIWISFRAAELAACYPDAGQYGSSEPVCRAAYVESLTRDRIRTLKVWLNGLPEGETCMGSVKRKWSEPWLFDTLMGHHSGMLGASEFSTISPG